MKRKIFRDISASTVQVIVNQFMGLAVFLLISRYLEKEIYGELNWSMAVLTFIFSLLSLRLEQIVIRKVAADEDASKTMTLFSAHILFFGLLFYVILLAGTLLFPGFFKQHDLLLILAISQLFVLFSSPFKQYANGRENFKYLAVMSSVANTVRVLWLIVLIIFSSITIYHVLVIYIISSLAELIISMYIVRGRMKAAIPVKVSMADYLTFIKDSLPQVGIVLLSAAIARIDWILLGVLTTSFLTAEYTFAYRVFELSPLPLLVIAPILLSRFSGHLSQTDEKTYLTKKKNELRSLIRIEMICATFIPLILNILWSPVMDAISGNKYGEVNKITFLILSCSVPFLYLNNLFWSFEFAQNRLHLIFRKTLVTFVIIAAGDILFIPAYQATGAATVYLCAIIIEYLNYLRTSRLIEIRETWLSLIVCLIVAMLAGFVCHWFLDSLLLQLFFGVTLYFVLLWATRQISKSDWAEVIQLLKKKKA